ncbi:unnamed protein product [Caenorhabditis auriculariae]|uniref:Uncharacterized protein n=1 Tax=Caenorhabditis auriculariae TaxID=2777116 RepID=A0A8S1GPS9_9PELO|nr:unnamed protein product [Caenorhabditis auriculariae]
MDRSSVGVGFFVYLGREVKMTNNLRKKVGIRGKAGENGERLVRTEHIRESGPSRFDLKKLAESQAKNGKQYSVYGLLIDSASTPQTIRNMPATLSYLERQMGAVTFEYLNKVGLNSYPNAMALWFNKQVHDLNRLVYDLPVKKADIPGHEKICYNYLNKEEFIMHFYEDAGYKTFLAEDWARGALLWPNCNGFYYQPTTHFNRPYQILLEESKKIMSERSRTCMEHHIELLDYLGKFIESYKGVPKFGWIWSSEVSHNYLIGSAHMDLDFRNFLLKHREELDNSFVFFMGDHGLRFGKYSRTPHGNFEANNAHLSISIPRELRSSTEIISRLRESSKKLQTHYDVFATLRDIVEFQPSKNYRDYEPMAAAFERGHSFLRHQPEMDRNCKTLGIPFAFCPCEYNTTRVDKTSKLAESIGRFLIAHIRKSLEKADIVYKCAPVVFETVLEVQAYEYMESKKSQLYHVTVKAAPPNNGTFKTVILKRGSPEDGFNEPSVFGIASRTVDRLDFYGASGNCAPYELAHFCHCIPFSTTTQAATRTATRTTTQTTTKFVTKEYDPFDVEPYDYLG